MLTPAIKKKTSICSFYFIKSLYGISQTWKSGITNKLNLYKQHIIFGASESVARFQDSTAH